MYEMHRGQSHLVESLRVYLNNRRRLQPVIGLDSITECGTAGAVNTELLYFCNVCVCRCSKADVRNHIFGSHHRFSYIKEWHPELLITWQEDNDLSAMAWPLMELAKKVEEKEGPGQAHLVEVEEALYQKMATLSENDAVALVMLLRAGQTEVVTCTDTSAASCCPVEPGRTVQRRYSEKSDRDDAPSQKTSCVSSENTSFLDDSTGTKPLIGLLHVVEYRSEDGASSCFLCHCCRISSNEKDIMDHLTSSEHIISYLMETCPEQAEALSADPEMLQSLVQKVEEDNGRGTLKVVNVPESLCKLLAAKSYHCCLMILRDGWGNTDASENKDTITGGTKTCRFTPRRKKAKRSTRRAKKMKNETETVFTVSLPLSGGPVLVERSSSILDENPTSPAADSDETHFQEPELFTGSDDSHFRRALQRGGEDVPGHISGKNLVVTLFQDVNTSPSEGSAHSQYEHVTETYGRRTNGNNHPPDSLETSREDYYKCQNDSHCQAPDDRLMTAVSSFPAYTHWDGSEEHCYMSYLNSDPDTKVPRDEEYCDVSSRVQQYNQQPECYQHMTGCSAAPPAGVPYAAWNNFYDPVLHLNPARTRMQAQYGDNCANHSLAAPEPSEQLYQTDQRPLQTDQGFDSDWV